MLSAREGKELLYMAREAIRSAFTDKPIDFSTYKNLSVYQQTPGVFVTIYQDSHVRGTMGVIRTSDPLYITIPQYARAAAFDDPRFKPIRQDEVSDIVIEVSVINNITSLPTDSPEELPKSITIGTDGLLMETDNGTTLLMPDSFEEAGCTPENALEMVCKKAELPEDAWKSGKYVFSTFNVIHFKE